MPIYSCGDGTYRIGDGECMYTSRASAESAYIAYLAEERDNHDNMKAAPDPNKVSFDFDDTLSLERWQNKAMMLKDEGKTVYIITRRQQDDSKAVYEVADKVGIPRSRVYFTNGKMKWETIKRLGIGTHYDNNPDEIRLIRENTDADAILIGAKSFEQKEETYNDYPDAAVNNAKRALKYKEENGSDCGTPVGWTRARQLANREKISRDTIARMASFKRHQQNSDVPYSEGCGGIMWDAWGGTAGIEWAIRKLNQIDNNKKAMIYKYKQQDLEIKDIDSKQGIISGYFSAFGNVDSDGDIMMPGAFKRSIQDWGPDAKGRIKHLMNHDPSQPLGKILELKEDGYGLFYRSQIGKHRLGQDFIKMVESDLIKEHSIGFRTLREQKSDTANEIHEVMLFEGSSLTAWGANEATPVINMKSISSVEDLKETIRNFEKFIRYSDVTDETIDLCLIKVRQLAQAVEMMSSTQVTKAEPEQPKMKQVPVDSFINIIKNI